MLSAEPLGPATALSQSSRHSAACAALSAVSLCDVSRSGECGVYLIRVLTCVSRGPLSLCTEPFAVCVCLQGDCSCLAALEVLYLAPHSDFSLASQGDRRCGFDRLLEAPGSAGLELASPVCAGSMCLSAGGFQSSGAWLYSCGPGIAVAMGSKDRVRC